MKILGLCGSIRDESSNQILLDTLKDLSSLKDQWTNFEIKSLPYFDPSFQFGENVPKEVLKLRKLAEHASYIVISTPEYAHGIPGILKNALEWLVCEETMKKKVAIAIAAPSGGKYVREYLVETLRTMDMLVDENLIFVVPNARKDLDQASLLSFVKKLC